MRLKKITLGFVIAIVAIALFLILIVALAETGHLPAWTGSEVTEAENSAEAAETEYAAEEGLELEEKTEEEPEPEEESETEEEPEPEEESEAGEEPEIEEESETEEEPELEEESEPEEEPEEELALELEDYSGFFKDTGSGDWYYFTDGKIDNDINDIIQDTDGRIDGRDDWYYVVDGMVQFDYTGVSDFDNENGWWYIRDGKVDFSYEGISQNQYGLWYVDGGQVDLSYSGECTFGDSTYGITDGKVDTDVVRDSHEISGDDFIVLNGNKGMILSHPLSREDFYDIVREYMQDEYVRGERYSSPDEEPSWVWTGGTRWDCSAAVLYFLNYYLLPYAETYQADAEEDPEADGEMLNETALSAVGEKAEDPVYEAPNSVSQAMAWGDPVYTCDTIDQLTEKDPGDLRYGDLLFYGTRAGDSITIDHVAVYLGQYYLDEGDEGYYTLENSSTSRGKVNAGRTNGVRISPFAVSQGESLILLHAARIFEEE